MASSPARVAIVTAGGSGMGAATATELARIRTKVAILSSSGKGELLARQLGGIGITGSNQSADDLQRLVDETVKQWGRIDVLVNSAGHGPRAPILDLTDVDWHAGLDTYLLNVIRPTRLVTPLHAEAEAPDNIRMNNVLPGFIDSFPEKPEHRERIPLQRYGKVEEIAATIAFLASDAAAYITGQNIRVDGGITRSV